MLGFWFAVQVLRCMVEGFGLGFSGSGYGAGAHVRPGLSPLSPFLSLDPEP